MRNGIVEIDASEVVLFLRDDLGRLPEEYDEKKVVNEVATYVRDRIKERTRSGLDIYMRRFADYSAIHATIRQLGSLQIEHVDLDFTGDMLGDISVTMVSDSEAIVGFQNTKERIKAAKHQFGLQSDIRRRDVQAMLARRGYYGPFPGGNVTVDLPARPFFGITEADTQAISRINEIHSSALQRAINSIAA